MVQICAMSDNLKLLVEAKYLELIDAVKERDEWGRKVIVKTVFAPAMYRFIKGLKKDPTKSLQT